MNIFDKIPKLQNGCEPVYDCGNGAFMLLSKDKTKADMDSYVNSAREYGYKDYDSTCFGDNHYLTMLKDDIQLHIYYTACDSSLRIVADPATQLYECKQAQVQRKCQTTMWQFEVDHSLIDCGMCYIIRCCDNSFFIIDSAHIYSVNDNERIYKFLRERTPSGEKIRIAGWFFSHGHVDHIGKFCDFLKYNCQDVEIEALYFNFVPVSHPDSIYWDISDKQFQKNFESIISGYPDIKKIKLHSGQHFFVRDLEFRVLCTHEDVYPQSMRDYNNSSTMLVMKVGDSVVNFPGDAGHIESDIVTSRFNELLKCDIVQASHHGHFGTTALFYDLCSADVILFPTTQIKFDEEYKKIQINRHAVSVSDECYIASNGTVEIDLPYKKGCINCMPDETFEDFDGIYNLWGYTYPDERKEELRLLFKKNSTKK